MKYVKMLGLAAVAAAALMAFVGAGTASATQLTCGSSLCPQNTTIHAVNEGGKAILDAPFGNVECDSTVHGLLENVGSSTATAGGKIGTLSFTNCGSDTVKVLANGSLEIHTEFETTGGTSHQKAASTNNGTLTSTGAEVTVIHLGFHCVYTTNATDIGTLTGSATTKGKATLDISATIPRTGGSSGGFCGASAPWTGKYLVETPNPLNVH